MVTQGASSGALQCCCHWQWNSFKDVSAIITADFLIQQFYVILNAIYIIGVSSQCNLWRILSLSSWLSVDRDTWTNVQCILWVNTNEATLFHSEITKCFHSAGFIHFVYLGLYALSDLCSLKCWIWWSQPDEKQLPFLLSPLKKNNIPPPRKHLVCSFLYT